MVTDLADQGRVVIVTLLIPRAVVTDVIDTKGVW